MGIGSGIAPFLPVPREPAGLYLPFHVFLALFRLSLEIPFAITYFLVLQWLPFAKSSSVVTKCALGAILGISGLWWTDLQIDGVKRG